MKNCPTCTRRLDSSWVECPYCKREREVKSKSGATEPGRKEREPMSDRDARNPTRVEESSARRETKYQPASDRPSSAVASEPRDNRKIVGILATYTWLPEGQIFHVREGRTHIGAGNIKEDTRHRQVEVCCPDDKLLSEDHAEILVQSKKIWIRDLSSTNGTFVNDEQLRPETAEDLPNNAEIKVGKTVFTFLRIEPRSATRTESSVHADKQPVAAERRDKTLVRET